MAKVSEIYGSMVFNEHTMQPARLSAPRIRCDALSRKPPKTMPAKAPAA